MTDFYTLWTDHGLKQLGKAAESAPFSLTHAVVGDGNKAAVTPNKAMTALVRKKWKGEIGSILRSEQTPTTVVYEFTIPVTAGPFTIREVGLLDADGKLCIVGNFPETVKPDPDSGSARDMLIRIPVHFENAENVSISVDSLTAASNAEVERKIAAHNGDAEAHPAIRQTIETLDEKADAHIARTDNPHGVTKAQVGLGNLPNAKSDSVSSGSSAVLATGKAVKTAYDHGASAHSKADVHIAKTDNPHGVTKAQVGLGNLPNGKSDSVTRTSSNHLATSKAVKTAYDHGSSAHSKADAHIVKTDNPHGVTKAQVGLGNLPNAKSDAVDSDSSEQLATSKAVKTVHDKAEANTQILNGGAAKLKSGTIIQKQNQDWEGGEICLEFGNADNGLNGDFLIIDQCVDMVRFYESGQPARGAYVKLSECEAGAGSRLTTTSDFLALKSENGYQKLPSGLVVQWGITTDEDSYKKTITFPIAFNTGCMTVVVAGADASYAEGGFRSQNYEKTSFMLVSEHGHKFNGYTRKCAWMAIGY